MRQQEVRHSPHLVMKVRQPAVRVVERGEGERGSGDERERERVLWAS